MELKKVFSVLFFVLALSLAGSIDSYAKLGGGQNKKVDNSCHQIFNFNAILFPRSEKPGECGNGNRIYLKDGSHEHLEVHDYGDGWYIEECGAEGATPIIVSDFPGNYVVAVMVNGKMDLAELDFCFQSKEVHDTTPAEHCLIDEFTIKRPGGKSRFQILTSDIFDAHLEDLTWSYEVNSNFKKALFKVFECPS